MYRDYLSKNIAEPYEKNKNTTSYESIMKDKEFTNMHVATPGDPSINIHIPEVEALYYEKYKGVKRNGTRNLQVTEQPIQNRELAKNINIKNAYEFDIRRKPDYVSLENIDFIPRLKGAMEH